MTDASRTTRPDDHRHLIGPTQRHDHIRLASTFGGAECGYFNGDNARAPQLPRKAGNTEGNAFRHTRNVTRRSFETRSGTTAFDND